MWFFIIAQDKINPLNLSQFLMGSLRIATGSNKQGTGVSAVSQSEQVAGFAVGNMSNSAGI